MLLPICHFKRHIAWTLIALFLFQAAGRHIAWFVAEAEAHVQANRYIKRHKGELLTLTVAADELKNMRVGDGEIRYQNGLYDVYTETPTADSVQLRVYRDTLEEALVGTLDALLSAGKKGPDNAPLNVLIAQLIGQSYLLPDNAVWQLEAPQESAADVFVATAYRCAGFATHFTPPPEV